MTLTSALRTATSALAANAKQVSVLSRNISGLGDENYVRRNAAVSTGAYGTVRVDTQRYVNRSVYDASILASANSVGANVVAAGLDRLVQLQGGNEFSYSPAHLLNDMMQATELAANSPSDNALLTSLVEQARTTATSLNHLNDEVLSMRATADRQINESVASLNSLLGQLETVNNQIVSGTAVGQDVFDSIDIRDQILVQISDEIGIKVIPRENNDIMVLANNGLLLFEKVPRSVSFQSTPFYGPTTTGGTLFIDGVPASGSNASLAIDSGKISGNLFLRDNILVEQQRQLDEVSRSLIELYAENDQSVAGTKPQSAGLFTWSGGPGIPASATLEPGIAMSIQINPLVDSQQGGDPSLIRDGGTNGDVDYVYNSGGGTGFSDRLFELSAAFSSLTTFDTQAGLPANQSLLDYASSSLDWLNGTRQSALATKNYSQELANRYKETLQNETGPNLDFEMSRLLEVERSFQASAKLISAVDEMFAILLEAA